MGVCCSSLRVQNFDCQDIENGNIDLQNPKFYFYSRSLNYAKLHGFFLCFKGLLIVFIGLSTTESSPTLSPR